MLIEGEAIRPFREGKPGSMTGARSASAVTGGMGNLPDNQLVETRYSI
jgi:hypothetical protein